MSLFQTTGYKSKSLVSDIALGIFDGIDNGLWCYAFAAIIFAGALSAYMPLLVVIMLSGWAVLGAVPGHPAELRSFRGAAPQEKKDRAD